MQVLSAWMTTEPQTSPIWMLDVFISTMKLLLTKDGVFGLEAPLLMYFDQGLMYLAERFSSPPNPSKATLDSA